jgi:hypothetical protein
MITADQLVAHAMGDYVLQNHWMATRKTSSTAVAFVHALAYTLPFALWFGASWALVPICLTHAVIDRFRLARYWCEWWGVGSQGKLWRALGAAPVEAPPPFLGVWLLIIVDNVTHVCINAASLYYLGGAS